MNQVAKKEQTAVVASYGDSLLEVIAKAARDPNVDIDKMERLLQMQERVQARDAETAFNVAMNQAQSEMRPVAANASNPQTRSRYATFDKLDRALRPIYTENGFSLSFDEGESPKPDHVRVVCYVSHIAGHTRTYHRDMPADGKGAKGGDVMTKTHAAGAAGSYGARYLLKGIFNVAVGEEDNDGNGYMGSEPKISDATWAMLVQLVEATETSAEQVCKAHKVDSLRDLSEAKAKSVIGILQKRLDGKVASKANG